MLPNPFIINRIYKRSDIHDEFGGSRQGGISPSARVPYIFIFSGDAGHQHGYRDQWENENIFSYTGEGQVGDMNFTKGNLALRDHLKLGKRVFLFIYVARGMVRYESELVFNDVDFFQGHDRNGDLRLSIKFFFKREGVVLNYQPETTQLSKVAESKSLVNLNIPSETERKGLVTSRVGQGAYRKSILHRWEYKCAVTEYAKREVLIASHIVPWKDASNEERLDVNNGILLSPTYDALFDRHLISFENSGKIILSRTLSESKYESLGVTGGERIKDLSKDNLRYLEKHRFLLI